MPVIGCRSGSEKTDWRVSLLDLKKSSSASRTASYIVPFLAPMRISRVEVE